MKSPANLYQKSPNVMPGMPIPISLAMVPSRDLAVNRLLGPEGL
jgi:hypothetical protein